MRREVKVGLFVLAGLSVVALVIFLIGEERQAFSSKETYYTVFKDVQGLRRGSPVRMGGVDIGSVSEVAYGENPKDDRIFVRMTVVANESKRIRKDTSATIEGKGLLGDKMIVLSVGSTSQPQLPPGSEVRSEPAQDLTAMVGKLGAVTAQVERVVINLERTTGALADQKLHDDLKSGVHSLSSILGSLERGEGYVGKLVNDPAEAERVSRAVEGFSRATAQLEQTSRSVNQILARVEAGPGLAHEVIYAEDGSKVAGQIGQAAEEVGLTLKGIREGKGLARGLLYGGDDQSDRLVRDLSEASADLKQIVADLRAGKGTVGALLVDPSVYEDLKLVLGNVQRNKALRALVRYSIRKDEPIPRVDDPDPASDEPSPRAAEPRNPPGASVGGALDTGARAADVPGR